MYNLGWYCFGKTFSRLGRFVGCELYENYSLGTLFDTHVLVHADALRYSTRHTHNNVRMLTAMMILLLHHTTPAILPEFDAANAP